MKRYKYLEALFIVTKSLWVYSPVFPSKYNDFIIIE